MLSSILTDFKIATHWMDICSSFTVAHFVLFSMLGMCMVFVLSSSCVLCTQCCQFLWIVHSWLHFKRLFDLRSLLIQKHCLLLIIIYYQSFIRNVSFIWCLTLKYITSQGEIKGLRYAKCSRRLHWEWQSGGMEAKNYVCTIFF